MVALVVVYLNRVTCHSLMCIRLALKCVPPLLPSNSSISYLSATLLSSVFLSDMPVMQAVPALPPRRVPITTLLIVRPRPPILNVSHSVSISGRCRFWSLNIDYVSRLRTLDARGMVTRRGAAPCRIGSHLGLETPPPRIPRLLLLSHLVNVYC